MKSRRKTIQSDRVWAPPDNKAELWQVIPKANGFSNETHAAQNLLGDEFTGNIRRVWNDAKMEVERKREKKNGIK